MNVLKAIRLEVQNFRSVGEKTEIDFTQLSKLVLIHGTNFEIDPVIEQESNQSREIAANNGSGKSTIIDAILFALYGRTLNAVDNRKLINRAIGPKLKTYCKFEFAIGENRYVSEAFLNIKGKSNPTVGFKFQVNDEEPIERNTPQMKEMIETQVLGCPYDMFKSSIVISQSSYLNFYEMTKAQRIAYVEQLFKLTVFSDLLKATRSDLNAEKIAYNAVNQKISQTASVIFDLKSRSDTFDEQQKAKKEQIVKNLAARKEALEAAEAELGEIALSGNPSDIEFAISLNREKIDAKTALLSKASAQLSSSAAKKAQLEAMINKHKEVLDILCSDCLSKAESLLNITESRKEIEADAEKAEKIELAAENVKKELSELRREGEQLQKNLNDYYRASRLVEQLQARRDYLKTEIADIEKKLEEATEAENPFGGLLEKNGTLLKSLKEELSGKSSTIVSLQILEAAFGDSGAKKQIFLDLVSRINQLLSHYLRILGASYNVVFSANFEFEFITPSGPSDFDSFSSGEKQRICLATMFTFRDLINNNRIASDFFILDEVLDVGIDENCVHRVCESLKVLTEQLGIRTFVISHNKTVIDKLLKFNQVSSIKAIKKDRKTHYELS